MEPVVHHSAQQIEVARAQRLDHESRASHVVHGVGQGHHLGQVLARLAGARRDGRHDHRHVSARHVEAPHEQLTTVLDDDDEAAVQGRGHVVGVALLADGACHQLVVRERPPQERVGGDQTGQHGRRARPEARRRGHVVATLDAHPRKLRRALFEKVEGRPDDGVGFVAGKLLCPLALDCDVQALSLEADGDLVPEVEGEGEAIESGTEVRGRGRHRDGDDLQHGPFVQERSCTVLYAASSAGVAARPSIHEVT